MKYLLLISITIYQKIIHEFLKNIFGISGSCRFSPTCSNYAKESIAKYGAVKGSMMALARISKCQPFYKVSYV